MKKKILSLSLSCLILLNGLLLSGCGECDHDWKDWETETEPTCTEEGEKVRKCKECGEKEKEAIEALGHTESDIEAVAATCTTEGSKNGKVCETCKAVLKEPEVVPVAEHNYIESIDVEVTCESNGTKKFSCANCDAYYTEEISAIGHSYTESIDTEATCVHSGTKKFTCANCNDYYNEEFFLESYTAQQIHEMVKNSVAEIKVTMPNGTGTGTGFVYTENGRFITNYHVIDGATSAKLTINGKTYDVTKVIAYDANIDLAIIEVTTTDTFTVIPLCEAVHPTGSRVYTLGSSLGFTDTFAEGIITNSRREEGNVVYIQHNADISSGNSGGPLINEYCEIIGINTKAYISSGGVAQNLNFSVAVEEIGNLTTVNKTLQEIYDEQHNSAKILKEYIINKNNYSDSTSYSIRRTSNNFNYSLTYSSSDFYYSLSYVMDDGTVINMMIWLDAELSGNYVCQYRDTLGNTVLCGLNAPTYTSETVLIPIDNRYELTTATLEGVLVLANVFTELAVQNFDIVFSDSGLTIKDLGFTSYVA